MNHVDYPLIVINASKKTRVNLGVLTSRKIKVMNINLTILEILLTYNPKTGDSWAIRQTIETIIPLRIDG